MPATPALAAARHRYRRDDDDPIRPGAFEWLADLNPGQFRHRDGDVNFNKIASAAGMVTSTLTRQYLGDSALTVAVMDALITLAMLHGIDESEAREALFVFEVPPETHAAARKARSLRTAIASVEAAA